MLCFIYPQSTNSTERALEQPIYSSPLPGLSQLIQVAGRTRGKKDLRTVCVVFTANRSVYPTSSASIKSVLIVHHGQIQIMWAQTVKNGVNERVAIHQV